VFYGRKGTIIEKRGEVEEKRGEEIEGD